MHIKQEFLAGSKSRVWNGSFVAVCHQPLCLVLFSEKTEFSIGGGGLFFFLTQTEQSWALSFYRRGPQGTDVSKYVRPSLVKDCITQSPRKNSDLALHQHYRHTDKSQMDSGALEGIPGNVGDWLNVCMGSLKKKICIIVVVGGGEREMVSLSRGKLQFCVFLNQCCCFCHSSWIISIVLIVKI